MDAADRGGRGLWLFLLVAFGISWIVWLPLLIGEWSDPLLVVGAFGPFAAAVIVTGREEGKSGLVRWLKQVFRLRIGLWWWLGAAFFFPIAVGAIQYAIYLLLGGEPDLSNLDYPWLAYPIALLLTTIFTGGNEEPGWRGFALPRLLEWYSPLIASLILGVIWVGGEYELCLVPVERSRAIGDHDLAFPSTRTQRDSRHAVPRWNERHRQLLPAGNGRGVGSTGLLRAPGRRVLGDRDHAAHRHARAFGTRTRGPASLGRCSSSDAVSHPDGQCVTHPATPRRGC
jgi:hypothetical protein